jgi:hypothetical protein
MRLGDDGSEGSDPFQRAVPLTGGGNYCTDFSSPSRQHFGEADREVHHLWRAADMKRSSWALLFWLSVASNGLSQRTGEEKLLKEVLRAYETRKEQRNPFWVRFDVTHTETAAWERAMGKKNAADVTSKILGEYACKGEKTRTWSHRQDRRIRGGEGVSFIIYNGEVQIRPSNRENEYMISKKPPPDREVEPPLATSGEEYLHDVLRMWAKGNARITKVSLTRKREKDEQTVVIAEMDFGSGDKTKCWFLPEQGYALRRVEIYRKGGTGPADRAEVHEFMTVNGIVYPKRGWREHYLRDGRLGYKTEFEVRSLETGAKEVPDSLFQFAIPKGAAVWDADLKVYVTPR